MLSFGDGLVFAAKTMPSCLNVKREKNEDCEKTKSGDLKKANRSLREWPKEKLESTSEKSFVPNTSDAKMPDVNAKEKSQRKDSQVSIRKLKT